MKADDRDSAQVERVRLSGTEYQAELDWFCDQVEAKQPFISPDRVLRVYASAKTQREDSDVLRVMATIVRCPDYFARRRRSHRVLAWLGLDLSALQYGCPSFSDYAVAIWMFLLHLFFWCWLWRSLTSSSPSTAAPWSTLT